ncbi:MAG: hypothetical protein Phog2KO_50770 [Phototrophicaceae bacterium]
MAKFDLKTFNKLKDLLEQELEQPNQDFLKLLPIFLHRDPDLDFVAEAEIQERWEEFEPEIMIIYQYHVDLLLGVGMDYFFWDYMFFEKFAIQYSSQKSREKVLLSIWKLLHKNFEQALNHFYIILKTSNNDKEQTLFWLLNEYEFGSEEFYQRVEEYTGLKKPSEGTQ